MIFFKATNAVFGKMEGEHLRLLFRSYGPSACLYCCTV